MQRSRLDVQTGHERDKTVYVERRWGTKVFGGLYKADGEFVALEAKRIREESLKILRKLFTCEALTAAGRKLRGEYLWEGRNRFMGTLFPKFSSLHLESAYAMKFPTELHKSSMLRRLPTRSTDKRSLRTAM